MTKNWNETHSTSGKLWKETISHILFYFKRIINKNVEEHRELFIPALHSLRGQEQVLQIDSGVSDLTALRMRHKIHGHGALRFPVEELN